MHALKLAELALILKGYNALMPFCINTNGAGLPVVLNIYYALPEPSHVHPLGVHPSIAERVLTFRQNISINTVV